MRPHLFTAGVGEAVDELEESPVKGEASEAEKLFCHRSVKGLSFIGFES
jgi:hypothetical protein